MKKLSLVILVVLLTGFHSKAQTYKIDSSDITYENKLRPCLFVTYDADPKTLKHGWESFVKKNYNIKMKGYGFMANKDLLTGNDVTIASISDKRMDMYVRVTDFPGGSEMKFFMSFGYDFFIGPVNYPVEFASMKKMLNDFSIEFLNDFYIDEASRLTRNIKKLEKDIKSNMKDIKRNNKKARKSSAEVAQGLHAKNTSLQMEIDQYKIKISEAVADIEKVKVRQVGVTRN